MAYANSGDPDQTAPEIWSESTLFAIPLGIFVRKEMHKKRNSGQKGTEYIVWNLGHLTYTQYTGMFSWRNKKKLHLATPHIQNNAYEVVSWMVEG